MAINRFGELDKELHRFIEEYVDSFVKWDLVTYFCYNADAAGTAEEIASRLGRKTSDVEGALKDLGKKGLLKRDDGDEQIYSYTSKTELREKVSDFCEALEDRDKRLEILAKLLRLKTTR